PGRRAGPARDPGGRAPEPARRAPRGRAGNTGRARLRHPPPLRRGLLFPPRLHVAKRERAVGDGVGKERQRRALPAVAHRRRPPPDLLRVGARGCRPRARSVDALPAIRTRRGRETLLRPRLLRRSRVMPTVREGQELFLVRVERGGPWDWSKDMREQELW